MSRLATACVGVLGVLASAAAGDWPQFLGPERNGIAPGAKIARNWPAGGPEMLWKVALGPGFGGPSIRGKKVYILDRAEDARDVLRCFELARERELWTVSYDAPGTLDHNGSRSAPTVDDKYVYTVGPFGHLMCVDLATQERVWHKHLLTDFGGRRPQWGVAQSPLLYKGTVIVAPLGQSAGVVALDKATGAIVWKSRPLGTMAYTSPMLATIGGVEQVLVISSAQADRPVPAPPTTRPAGETQPRPRQRRVNVARLAGVDPSSGEVLWTYDGYACDIPIPSPAHLGDGRIFLTGGYDAGSVMVKVAREGGKFTVQEVFRLPRLGAQIHNPIFFQGHLYVLCNTNSRRDGLVCVDMEGQVKWQTARQPNFDRGGFILADGVLLIMDGESGMLRMVQPDPGGYKALAQAKVLSGKEIWAPMALSEGKLVLRDQREMKCLMVAPTP